MATIQLISSLETSSQIPLDAKLYAKTLAELQVLGTDSYKAFSYHEDMEVKCVENHTTYMWREELVVGETLGLLPISYVYPAGVITAGIDYSNRVFNFFVVSSVSVPVTTPTYSTGIETDAALSNQIITTCVDGTAGVFNAPTNPTIGQTLTYTIRNTRGSAMLAITFNVIFKLATFVEPATAFSRSITFRYDGTNWVEISRTTADIPN